MAMTFRPGDRVKVFGTEWVVAGVAPTYLYLTNPDAPAWAPQRHRPGVVTHVWRNGTWEAISPIREQPDCDAQHRSQGPKVALHAVLPWRASVCAFTAENQGALEESAWRGVSQQ